MKRFLARLCRAVPVLNQLPFLHGAFKGHFYSPIPSLKEIQRNRESIFAIPRSIPGIDLCEDEQLKLVEIFASGYYPDQPFREQRVDGSYYFFDNGAFCHADAIMLHCMLRHFRPRRIVEVGSGFSSCVMLDTNRLFLNNSVGCTFIDPYPQVLQSLAREHQDLTIIGRRIQDVPLNLFAELQEGDVLFIDSSHVSKVGSDVNHIFFKILPALRPGVRVHFHDIFYPFEYPEEWVMNGRSWTEAYVLRAFLEYNSAFTVELFPNFLMQFHQEWFAARMPVCLKNTGGSIWLRKKNAG
jgi:Methyltransferase domain